jgi:bifunctional non-homologous end joining protein LigD
VSTVAVGTGRHAVRVARAEKVLFPARDGAPEVTKADLAAYYRDIAPYALPHLKDPWAPMTSGSRGLHLTVPLDRRADVDEVRDFARRVADTLAARHPRELTTEPRKIERGNRLFIDVLRNGYAQTAVAPWSVRALPGAPVAAPISREALDDPELSPRRWTVGDALEHAREDPWDGLVPARGRSLGPAARRLRALG